MQHASAAACNGFETAEIDLNLDEAADPLGPDPDDELSPNVGDGLKGQAAAAWG